MGGKSGNTSPAPPAYTPPPPNNDEIMMQYMNSIMSMQAGMASQIPQLPPTPEIERDPIINWAEKNEELIAKSKADYNVDKARRKGRFDTILTSPLLDDEDPETTASLIAS